MFDELKEVKHFVTDSYRVLKCKILERNKTFKESSKSRGAFRTQTSINFFVNIFNGLLFSQ